jgi:hypothetical protein
MRATLLLAILCLSACAAGCVASAGYPTSAENVKAELAAMQPYFKAEVFAKYEGKTTEPDRQKLRNEIVNGRLRAIDLNFHQFERAMNLQGNVVSISTDVAVLALSAAGATIASAGTKATLAAISGGITGGKTAVDKDLFFSKTMPALFAQMEALRKGVLVRIVAGLQMDTAQYPLPQALNDLGDYANAGSIPAALQGISAAAGQESQAKDQQLQELRATYLRDTSGNLLQTFWRPDGKNYDLQHQQALDQWIKDNKVAGQPLIEIFIRSDKYAKERAEAVKHFGLDSQH